MAVVSIATLNSQFESDDASTQAVNVIEWAIKNHHGSLALAMSFSAEDLICLDLIQRQARSLVSIEVFCLDTGRLHESTYRYAETLRNKYNLTFKFYSPDPATLEALVSQQGTQSFLTSVEHRKECCRVRKLDPLTRALNGNTAWVTGLRRSQSTTRTTLDVFQTDNQQRIRIAPLAAWSERAVWDYIKTHSLPTHPLYAQSYPSIGCEPCTRPVPSWSLKRPDDPNVDIRSGRWWWENPEHKECGIHSTKGISP